MKQPMKSHRKPSTDTAPQPVIFWGLLGVLTFTSLVGRVLAAVELGLWDWIISALLGLLWWVTIFKVQKIARERDELSDWMMGHRG